MFLNPTYILVQKLHTCFFCYIWAPKRGPSYSPVQEQLYVNLTGRSGDKAVKAWPTLTQITNSICCRLEARIQDLLKPSKNLLSFQQILLRLAKFAEN
jgi:hypothetical protein